jgi:EmrB/QacA subfamily drug resistance transporter
MKQPCDEAAMRAEVSSTPCRPESRPWVLAVTIVGSSLAFIDGTVVNVALPALQEDLHASVVDIQWVVEGYGLFLSALILVGGGLGDVVGRRLMFLLGTGVFAAASIACGLSTHITGLVIGRCAQGIGAAALVPNSLAIISASFDEKSRGQAIGTWSGFTAITTALGPVIGGWLIEHASWHWVFFINVPLAAFVIVVALYHVPESRSTRVRAIDWQGALVATLSLGGFLYGLIESATLGWAHPRIVVSLLVGLVTLILFVTIEERVRTPMVPFAIFKSRTFAGANLLTLLLYSALGIFFFLFPLNLIQAQGYSTTATGAASLPTILLMFFLSRWSGGLVSRYGPKTPLVIGPVIVALGFLLFARTSVGSHYWTTFFPGFIVLGLGLVISVAPLTTVVMSSVEQDRAGTASGINNAIARLAGVLAVAILGVVMVQSFGHKLQDSLNELKLPSEARNEIQANKVKLGGLQAPNQTDSNTKVMIHTAVREAFVFGFRIIMVICACLALVSAGIAWRLIPADEIFRTSRDLSTVSETT